MFAYCSNQPINFSDPTGYEQEARKVDMAALGGAVTFELLLLGGSQNIWEDISQSLSRFVANTKADLKRLSRTLVDSGKKRWEDSQPCIHHVVPQGCTCESANKARDLIEGKEQSVNNQVIINYETHRSIHANGHAYCATVYNTLNTNGVRKGMKILKMAILLDATAKGGYFYGWI